MLSNGVAWDMTWDSVVPAGLERDLRTAVDGRMAQIWMTPHGFIKAAQAGQTTARVEEIRGAKRTILTVTTPSKVKLEGVLDEKNLVEHIETWLSHPMIGDMVYEADFDGYRDFGGVRFPTRIVHRSAGYPVLDVTITEVKPNEQLWSGPRTINPDRLARSARKATFEGVPGARTFTDGAAWSCIITAAIFTTRAC